MHRQLEQSAGRTPSPASGEQRVRPAGPRATAFAIGPADFGRPVAMRDGDIGRPTSPTALIGTGEIPEDVPVAGDDVSRAGKSLMRSRQALLEAGRDVVFDAGSHLHLARRSELLDHVDEILGVQVVWSE